MVNRPRSVRDISSLGSYLGYAMVLHALVLALGLSSSCHATLPVELAVTDPSPMPIDLDTEPASGEHDLGSILPGGGAAPPDEKLTDRDHFPEATRPLVASVTSTAKARAARAAPNDNAILAAATADPSNDTPAAGTPNGDPARTATTGVVADAGPEADDTESPIFPHSFDPVQAALARRQSDYTGEYGSGPGRNGGPGGLGIGAKPIPAIHGDSPFGNATTGAFRGTVCFIPERTRSLYAVRSCDPVGSFYTNVFDVDTRSFTDGFPGVSERFEWFEIEYQGTFKVAKSGVYDFRLMSDDGSLLFIDGSLVVDNDGIHGPNSRNDSTDLTAGPHRMRLLYYQGPRTQIALQLFVTPPGASERLFGPSF